MRSLRSEEEIVDRVLEILGDHVTMPTKTAKAVVMSFLAADAPLPPWPIGDELNPKSKPKSSGDVVYCGDFYEEVVDNGVESPPKESDQATQ